ncbi:stereocilin [Aplysia californica]|uniref:Stereocilin n=1 Tax=Aplysia californica TaxID=6500 RepID=A0ABM1A9Y1_APLCA|nr:stereocilin [Aplysia californica]
MDRHWEHLPGLSSLLQNNPQRLEDMGSMIVDIDVNLMGTLDTDSQQVFVSSTQKVMESLGKVQKEAASRPSSEISDTEKDSDKAKVKKLTQEIFSMHLSVSFSKRRKRSTPAADCATIQSFNGALSFLTASDISAMSNSEFTDCLAEFQTTSWDSSQLEAFAAQLIDSFGSDSSTWTKDNVLDAGVLLDALNSTHILNLTVIDDDALSTLGTYTFTNNAAHIMTSYMTTQNIADVSTISASVLGNTGNLLCGFNSTQMQSLDSNAVDTASSDLSSVSCLESDQLTTLSNKIVEVQGTDWSTKTADQITTLGVLAGGLPASVLEDLGSDQLASISTVAIANMDTTTFSTVFTVDKISSLSSSQANAVTQDQLNSLSADQLSAVTAVATTTTAGGNGASGVVVSIWTLCLLLLAAAMPLAV